MAKYTEALGTSRRPRVFSRLDVVLNREVRDIVEAGSVRAALQRAATNLGRAALHGDLHPGCVRTSLEVAAVRAVLLQHQAEDVIRRGFLHARLGVLRSAPAGANPRAV